MTYSCANPDDLHEITSKIEENNSHIEREIAEIRGTHFTTRSEKKAREGAQKVCRKYRPVLKSVLRGRPKTDWRYHNRVGKKATELRKETQQSKTTSYNTLDTGIPPSDWKYPTSPNSNGHEKKRISSGKVIIYTLNILTTYTILYLLP